VIALVNEQVVHRQHAAGRVAGSTNASAFCFSAASFASPFVDPNGHAAFDGYWLPRKPTEGIDFMYASHVWLRDAVVLSASPYVSASDVMNGAFGLPKRESPQLLPEAAQVSSSFFLSHAPASSRAAGLG
jgi:hypothetical protein